MSKRKLIQEAIEKPCFLSKLDTAIIGVFEGKVVYSEAIILNELCNEFSFDESYEWFEYNILNLSNVVIVQDYFLTNQENANKP